VAVDLIGVRTGFIYAIDDTVHKYAKKAGILNRVCYGVLGHTDIYQKHRP
jgi:hypothetical protein